MGKARTGLGIALALASLAWIPSGVARADVTISLKTFDQLYNSLAVATRVTPDTAIKTYFDNVKLRLPKTGDVEEMSAPMLTGLTGLSGLFCERMIANDARISTPANRRAHRQVDFTKTPADMTEAIRQSVATEYARLFWQRDPTAAEQNLIVDLIGNAITTDDTTAAATPKILKIACTATATSLLAIVN